MKKTGAHLAWETRRKTTDPSASARKSWKNRGRLTRWVSLNGGPRPGPPTISLDCGHELIFDSWASFRELAMTMRGILSGHFGRTKTGGIRKRRNMNA